MTTWTAQPQPNSTQLWMILDASGVIVADALSERFAKQVCKQQWALAQLIADLPINRDWLDPDLERLAKEALNP